MDDRPDNRQGQPPHTRPESPPSTAGPAGTVAPQSIQSADPVLERLDRLSDLLMRRIDRLEERVRTLEQDNGEIINLLIAVKAGLEEASGDLIAQLEEADDSAGHDAGTDDGSEDGALFEVPCGPTMLH
ncbi:hypothetical protein J2848_004015 [Azospirillum lipoferum]|uniref:Uncharacterized protein n=1 Tax=Azospirillum lipoferum TaxID=193 RepID=A0A5A9GEM6_AZOLI|nr:MULTISPECIES: hypothetical protein [Azospirillum]KAA0592184.1 hypothetical protein FZ942_28590 [Azospirillum lipoferum]MCP1612335.1 hypothetical protein [Azospirillum lipoferum]MDW5536443.1 hypothetical protein [Azospirillum sp. NL1]